MQNKNRGFAWRFSQALLTAIIIGFFCSGICIASYAGPQIVIKEEVLPATAENPLIAITPNFESAETTLPFYIKNLFSFSNPPLWEKIDAAFAPMTWAELETELIAVTEEYSGDWSIYVKDLSTQKTLSVNDHARECASLIKLYIMGTVLEQIELGQLEQTDKISALLDEMITVSDNEAANELVRLLNPNRNHREGMKVVNDFITRHGYNDTQQINGLEDRSLWVSSSEVNETSARDCGEFLSSVYEGTLVSHLASRKMETLLLGQKVRYKIPTGLPNDVISASKTGEMDSVENDVAIVYSKGGDFILCVLSSDWSSGNEAIGHIREISKLVYHYYNPVIEISGISESKE